MQRDDQRLLQGQPVTHSVEQAAAISGTELGSVSLALCDSARQDVSSASQTPPVSHSQGIGQPSTRGDGSRRQPCTCGGGATRRP
jgi:hypothetical protein